MQPSSQLQTRTLLREQSTLTPQAIGNLLPALESPDVVAEAKEDESIVGREGQAEEGESKEELDVIATRRLARARCLGGRQGLVSAVQDAMADEVEERGCGDDVGGTEDDGLQVGIGEVWFDGRHADLLSP